MALSAGTRIGPYEIVSALGAGGMGEVYRARDTKLDRDVALKILPESFASDPDRLMRFEREAKTLAALNHPNIAHIHGLEESGEVRALAMELVEGEDLSERIARGPMPLAEVLPIARQFAEALEAAHDAGIVHRDLKPPNIKVRDDGTVKVLDFGLAKALDSGTTRPGDYAATTNPGPRTLDPGPTMTSPAMTQLGVILGTAAYMSPEQAKGRPVDRRADVWAFGCVMAEMLTGRRAFPGDDVSETLASILAREPDVALPEGTPAPVRRLIARCLEKDAKKRLRDIGDAMRRLDEDLEDARAGSVGDGEPLQSNGRRMWLVAVALAVVAAAGAFVVGRGVGRSAAPEARRFAAAFGGTIVPDSLVTISPDGQRVAYVGHDASDRAFLMTRRLDEEQETQVRELEGEHGTPFFSFDSRWIALANDGRLVKIAVTGGPVTPITDGGVTNYQRVGYWGAAGDILLSMGFNGVSLVHTTDGSSSVVLPNESSATFLPDGRTKLVGREIQASAAAASIPFGAGTPRSMRFVPGDPAQPAGYIVYIDGDNVLQVQPFDAAGLRVTGPPVPLAEQVAFFSVSDTGTVIFQRAPGLGNGVTLGWLGDDGRVDTIVNQPGNYAWPTLSPDGRQLAFEVNERNESYIAIHDLAAGTTRRLSPPGVKASGPQWMPRGDGVLFSTGDAVWYVRADGVGAPRRLFDSSATIESISPNGQMVALTTPTSAERARDIEVAPLTGEGDGLQAGTPQLVVTGPADEINARFSPDGRWLAYSSSESGGYRIYVLSVANPESRWLASEVEGYTPNWAPTANQLFFRTLGGAPGSVVRVASYSVSNGVFVPGETRPFAADTTALLPAAGASSPYSVAADGRVVIRIAPAEADGPRPARSYGVILNAGALIGGGEQ